jgi:hypothetical protein
MGLIDSSEVYPIYSGIFFSANRTLVDKKFHNRVKDPTKNAWCKM